MYKYYDFHGSLIMVLSLYKFFCIFWKISFCVDTLRIFILEKIIRSILRFINLFMDCDQMMHTITNTIVQRQ